MRKLPLWCALFLTAVSIAPGGTFTTSTTTILVPANATGADSGDTSSTNTDTIGLDARLYVPDGVVAPAPVVVVIHGFGGSKDDDKIKALAGDLAFAGYVVLTPTMRGCGNSGGQVTLAGPNEVNDLKTIMLAMQSGTIGNSPATDIPVNGSSKFGILGASYGGGHSFEILRTHVAGLSAVMPIIGWSDLYQALAPNNVPKLAYTLGLFAGGFDPVKQNYADVMFDWASDLLSGTPEKTRIGNPKANIDWRSVVFDPAELTVPTFVVQGWKDYLFPAEQALTLLQTNTAIPFFKLYIGGLGHPPASLTIDGNEAVYLSIQAVRWFDFWLKGIDTGITNEPPITFAPENTQDWSANALISAATFPLPGTTTATYYLSPGKISALALAPPTISKPKKIAPTGSRLGLLTPLELALGGTSGDLASAIDAVNAILNAGATDILDPRISTKDDPDANKVSFGSPPLTNDVLVTGSPVVQLYVSASKSKAYYFVQIEERSPSGTAKLITRGAFKDSLATPKTPHLIQFSPFAIHHRFLAGSQIKLRISSRDYPFFLPNRNQPKIVIYGDNLHPSSLSLPVVLSPEL